MDEKRLSDERVRSVMDYLFGERLRAMRLAKATASTSLPAVASSPTRKRKREMLEWTETDDLEEERARKRRPVLDYWMPRWGVTPLLEASSQTVAPAWRRNIHFITLEFEGRTTSFWSVSNERNHVSRSDAIIFIGGFDFPEDHYYIIDFIRGGYISVTGFLHEFFPDFDAKRDIYVSYCLRATRPDSPYFGMTTKEQVVDFWDKTRDNGTCYHAAMDDVLQGRPSRTYQVGKSDVISRPPNGFYRFMTDYPDLVIYWTEFSVVDRDLVLVGQFDALFWDKGRQCFVLVDWKNVLNFRTTSSERGTDPLTADMPDCHLSHYTVQLNVYRALVERHLGIVIADMWIVSFPPLKNAEAAYELHRAKRLDMNKFFARCPTTAEGRARKVFCGGEREASLLWTHKNN
jgi:hypothetical protein